MKTFVLILAVGISLTNASRSFAQSQFLTKYSGAYSVDIGKSDWGEIYVITKDGKAKWMFLDARTKPASVLNTLEGNWTAKDSYIKISINANPNGVEEYEMKDGIFQHKTAKFKRYLKPTTLPR